MRVLTSTSGLVSARTLIVLWVVMVVVVKGQQTPPASPLARPQSSDRPPPTVLTHQHPSHATIPTTPPAMEMHGELLRRLTKKVPYVYTGGIRQAPHDRSRDVVTIVPRDTGMPQEQSPHNTLSEGHSDRQLYDNSDLTVLHNSAVQHIMTAGDDRHAVPNKLASSRRRYSGVLGLLRIPVATFAPVVAAGVVGSTRAHLARARRQVVAPTPLRLTPPLRLLLHNEPSSPLPPLTSLKSSTSPPWSSSGDTGGQGERSLPRHHTGLGEEDPFHSLSVSTQISKRELTNEVNLLNQYLDARKYARDLRYFSQLSDEVRTVGVKNVYGEASGEPIHNHHPHTHSEDPHAHTAESPGVRSSVSGSGNSVDRSRHFRSTTKRSNDPLVVVGEYDDPSRPLTDVYDYYQRTSWDKNDPPTPAISREGNYPETITDNGGSLNAATNPRTITHRDGHTSTSTDGGELTRITTDWDDYTSTFTDEDSYSDTPVDKVTTTDEGDCSDPISGDEYSGSTTDTDEYLGSSTDTDEYLASSTDGDEYLGSTTVGNDNLDVRTDDGYQLGVTTDGDNYSSPTTDGPPPPPPSPTDRQPTRETFLAAGGRKVDVLGVKLTQHQEYIVTEEGAEETYDICRKLKIFYESLDTKLTSSDSSGVSHGVVNPDSGIPEYLEYLSVLLRGFDKQKTYTNAEVISDSVEVKTAGRVTNDVLSGPPSPVDSDGIVPKTELTVINDTLLPTSDTSVPTNDTSVPTNDTSVPTNDTSVPTSDTSVPTNDTTVPTNDTTVPTNDTSVPTNDTTVPTNDTTVPTNDTSVPMTATPLNEDNKVLSATSMYSDNSVPITAAAVQENCTSVSTDSSVGQDPLPPSPASSAAPPTAPSGVQLWLKDEDGKAVEGALSSAHQYTVTVVAPGAVVLLLECRGSGW
ncbi:uncharacterized protein LOC121871371 [Homarus americanus]|uniref:uncharacterized protein LOC121871371 n=1 Tax=Homarus americanus TaxID=6706 RepID=UPI001C43CE45|nr:uncharacterized protein LOC121871371 [Homarus americanus]XP_042229525.1 uncharacterized protein LOC121871371 [Homarus americanus]XP_042229526.1 uncharacterized protein LOC121871371 [Homarus americanus]